MGYQSHLTHSSWAACSNPQSRLARFAKAEETVLLIGFTVISFGNSFKFSLGLLSSGGEPGIRSCPNADPKTNLRMNGVASLGIPLLFVSIYSTFGTCFVFRSAYPQVWPCCVWYICQFWHSSSLQLKLI